MISFLAFIFFIICLVIIIRLYCYIRFKNAIFDFKCHIKDVVYAYKKNVKSPLWFCISNEEDKKKWVIMPRELNNKGFIAFYPGNINFKKLSGLSTHIMREDVNLPIFRCRCQDCQNEFNSTKFCDFLLKIKNKYALNELIKNPKNKKKEYIFPKYCDICYKKKKKNLYTITDNETNVYLDPNTTDLCYLCLNKKLEMKCFPCGCDCYCKSCSRKMVNKIKEKKKKNMSILDDDICNKCPICRTTITHFLKKTQD